MALEILNPEEMAQADRAAIAAGPFDGYGLMRNAGAAVTAEVLARWPAARHADILCGPGNNGGDGYVVARLLVQSGFPVNLWAEASPRAGSDAARAAADCPLPVRPLSDFSPTPGSVVVDALYGAGLSGALRGDAARAAIATTEAGPGVVAVDLPSGLSGLTGRAEGPTFRADVTVTFERKKPGHLLYPGRTLCGEVVVADIGIGEAAIDAAAGPLWENDPTLWRHLLPVPGGDTHKYRRGHAGVFSGGPASTGAARLAAIAAARAGAGAVTVLSPGSAVTVNAARLTSIMVRRIDDPEEALDLAESRRLRSVVIGPGFGVGEKLRAMTLALLGSASSQGKEERTALALVLDADAITSFRDAPRHLFEAIGRSGSPVVLTPHEGEFARLFPDIADRADVSKIEKARRAAARSAATILFKGPDTVVAAPDGRATINTNGVPWLATAGSGDVLAGIVAGLAAQEMPAWEAACAAVWMHAEGAKRFGPGLIAEDLPALLPAVLRMLLGYPPTDG